MADLWTTIVLCSSEKPVFKVAVREFILGCNFLLWITTLRLETFEMSPDMEINGSANGKISLHPFGPWFAGYSPYKTFQTISSLIYPHWDPYFKVTVKMVSFTPFFVFTVRNGLTLVLFLIFRPLLSGYTRNGFIYTIFLLTVRNGLTWENLSPFSALKHLSEQCMMT